uniref:F-box associated beta-propeller type 3 domain-containing protein n=1 Tax=Arundo donax TaxID=35708 RepID=A0A0A8ZH45_ARUDO
MCKKAPQTLSSFFYRSCMVPAYNPSGFCHHFTSVSGRGWPMVDPSLSFLFSATYSSIEFMDSCNGLILCLCQKVSMWPLREIEYIVCNPATEKWTVLPNIEAMKGLYTMYLGFDPAVSLHFTVFSLVDYILDSDIEDENAYWHHQIKELEIYSSETGNWAYHQSEWADGTRVVGNSGVFFNGTLHVTTIDSSVITVNTKGKTWRKIPTPYYFSFIGMSQGHLYAVHRYENGSQLAIWVLEDYNGDQWGLKHMFNVLDLCGTHHISLEDRSVPVVIAIHPECSLLFLVANRRILVSYNVDKRKVCDICTLGNRYVLPYLPYISCFSEGLSGGS